MIDADKPFKTVDVLSVPLYCGKTLEAVDHVVRICQAGSERRSRCISATGAHGIVYANKNPVFMAALRNFYMNLCDGRPGMWIGRIKGRRQIGQIPGADFFESILTTSVGTGIKHYFCGGKPGVAEQLKITCEEKFNNQRIVGTYSPPFRAMSAAEFQQLADNINRTGADIVWIGISTPKQEIFAQELARYTKVHFIVTIGAAFDFHSSNLKRAPHLFTYLGVEWLYRLVKEPQRLYKRVLETIPAYIWLNACEFFNYFIGKRRSHHE